MFILVRVIIICFVLCGSATILSAEEKFDASIHLHTLGTGRAIADKGIGVGGSFGYRFSQFLFLDVGATYL